MLEKIPKLPNININNNMKAFLFILGLIMLIDLPMILFINKDMYMEQLKRINGCDSCFSIRTVFASIVCYILLTFGIYYFGIREKNFINAILFGLVVYGVYNTTNLATIQKFGIKESIIDTLWGATMCGLVAFCVIKSNFISTPINFSNFFGNDVVNVSN